MFQLDDYYTISVLYGHTSGSTRYDETISYVVAMADDRCYLLELTDDTDLSKLQSLGEISGIENMLVYEISEETYLELDAFITEKP